MATARRVMEREFEILRADTLTGLKPRWSCEPDTDVLRRICSSTLNLGDEWFHLEFMAQSSLNELYRIYCSRGKYVARISLPLDPPYKKRSEVATIEFVRQYTTTPVPRIIAFDCSHENELGFEWCIMELVPGELLGKVWRDMEYEAKVKLVQCVADWATQLFAIRFDKIGSLYRVDNGDDNEAVQHDASSTASHPKRTRMATRDSTGLQRQTEIQGKMLLQHAGQSVQSFTLSGSLDGEGFLTLNGRVITDGDVQTTTSDSFVLRDGPNQKLAVNDDQMGYEEDHASTAPVNYFKLGRTVEFDLSWRVPLFQNINHGPYSSAREWLQALLDAKKYDIEILIESQDVGQRENAAKALRRASKIQSDVDRCFPDGHEELITTLVHSNLSLNKILVVDGEITGVVDWEYINAVPLWYAANYPKFLQGRDRDEPHEPIPRDEDGKPHGSWWERFDEWERTKLRRVWG